MATPELTFDYYKGTYHGTLDEDAFKSVLPRSVMRLVHITGDEVPEAFTQQWLFALCVICERECARDSSGAMVKSETVGSVSVTYADADLARTDFDAVKPFLASTGLLFRGVECR